MRKVYCKEMKFFSIDGPLYKFLSTLWDVIKLNILWMLFSLPIVTFGAATVAAYSVTLKMVEDHEGYVGRQFLQAFKANLKQGIPMGLLFLFCCYVVYLDFELYRVYDEPTELLVFGLIAIIVFVMLFLYAFPLSARYENSFVNTLKNSVNICTRYIVRTIALLAVIALEIMVFLFNSLTILFGFLIGPLCIMFTVSGFALYLFHQIEKENS